jgi:hypothetical protein
MSEAIVMKTQVKIKDFFQGSKARKDFFAKEEMIAYDTNELLSFEAGFARHRFELHGTGDGLPSFAALMTLWRRARDSWKRIMEALPVGELRDAMALELADRDASMDDLADKACAMIATKLAKGEVDA